MKVEFKSSAVGLGFVLALCSGGAAVAQSTAPASSSNPAEAAKSPEGKPAGEAETPTTAGIQDIVVTAERRAGTVQRTGVSVSVRDGETLRQQGRSTLQQILENVPGVSIDPDQGNNNSDAPGSDVTVRGVRSNGRLATTILGGVATVAQYVDGIYFGIGGNHDVSRIEVLRGPQGTLYGRSATAGVIATYTENPAVDQFEARGQIEVGDYEVRHGQLAVNVPLISDKLAIRVSGDKFDRQGYDNSETFQHRDSLRVKLLAKPTESLSILTGFALENNRSRAGGTTITAPTTSPTYFTYAPIALSDGHNEFRQYWGDVTWDLGPLSVNYVGAYRTYTQDTTLYAVGPSSTILRVKQNVPSDHFQTHELHLTSDPASRLKWQTGLFYYNNRVQGSFGTRYVSSGALTSESVADKQTTNFGVFAEGTYPIADNIRLNAGIRYDDTKVVTIQTLTRNKNSNFGVPNSPTYGLKDLKEDLISKSLTPEEGTRKFQNVTWKVRGEIDLTPRNMIYASVATGFLPGDVQVANVTAGTQVGLQVLEYDAETLTAYEIGSKNRFFGNLLQVNGALYYNSYAGYQINVNVGTSTDPQNTTMNAPARMKGGEVEIVFTPTRNDVFAFNLGYVDAQFHDASAQFSSFVSGTRIPRVPSTTANISYAHTFHIGDTTLTPRVEARYISSYELNTMTPAQRAAGFAPYYASGDQWVQDLGLTWVAGKNLSLTAYLRNVGNRRYKSSFVNSGSTISANTVTLTEPRRFGAVLSFNF